jgi:hypothetical protein
VFGVRFNLAPEVTGEGMGCVKCSKPSDTLHEDTGSLQRFEVITAVKIQVEVLCVVMRYDTSVSEDFSTSVFRKNMNTVCFPIFIISYKLWVLWVRSGSQTVWVHLCQKLHCVGDMYEYIRLLHEEISSVLSVSLSSHKPMSHFHIWLLVRTLLHVISVMISICLFLSLSL